MMTSDFDMRSIVFLSADRGEREELALIAQDVAYWAGMYELGSAYHLMLARLRPGTVIVVGARVDGLSILKLVNWVQVMRPDLVVVFLHDGDPRRDPRQNLLGASATLDRSALTARALTEAIQRAMPRAAAA